MPERCLGGNQCAQGYDGEVCGVCAPKYYRLRNACLRCPGFPWHLVILAIILLILLIIVMRYGISPSTLTRLKLLIDHMQSLAVILTIPINWPPEFLQFLDYLKWLSFDMSLFAPECMVSNYNWYLSLVSTLFMPVFVVLLILPPDMWLKFRAWFLRLKVRPGINARKAEAIRARVMNVRQKRGTARRIILMLVISTYIPITTKLLEGFDCVDTGESTSLRKDTNIDCTTSSHIAVLVIACHLLFALTVMMPYIVARFLIKLRNKNLLNEPRYLWNYGALYETYNDKFVYMESIVMWRKALIILCMIFTSGDVLLMVCDFVEFFHF